MPHTSRGKHGQKETGHGFDISPSFRPTRAGLVQRSGTHPDLLPRRGGTGATGVFRSEDGELLDFVFPSGGPTFVKTDATDFAVAGEMRVTFSFGPTISAEVPVPVPIPLPPALLAAPAGFALALLAARRLRPSHGRA